MPDQKMTPEEALEITKFNLIGGIGLAGEKKEAFDLLRRVVEENEKLRDELARLKALVTEEEQRKMLNWFDGIEQGLSFGAWKRIRANIRDLIVRLKAPTDQIPNPDFVPDKSGWTDATGEIPEVNLTEPTEEERKEMLDVFDGKYPEGWTGAWLSPIKARIRALIAAPRPRVTIGGAGEFAYEYMGGSAAKWILIDWLREKGVIVEEK